MQACPQCEQSSGLYTDDVMGKLQCDNCGWYEGKKIERPEPAPEVESGDPAPEPTCEPVVWYTTDDDGIHLICEEHGDNLVGFDPTIAELILARAQHCGAVA